VQVPRESHLAECHLRPPPIAQAAPGLGRAATSAPAMAFQMPSAKNYSRWTEPMMKTFRRAVRHCNPKAKHTLSARTWRRSPLATRMHLQLHGDAKRTLKACLLRHHRGAKRPLPHCGRLIRIRPRSSCKRAAHHRLCGQLCSRRRFRNLPGSRSKRSVLQSSISSACKERRESRGRAPRANELTVLRSRLTSRAHLDPLVQHLKA